jgi:putative ABC transport system substrate-binding protein
MRRRDFVRIVVALAACLAPFGLPSAADAQQPPAPRRVGVLLMGLTPDSKQVQGLRQGLQDLGYVEGRDVVFEWRSARGDYDRAPELASDLVKHGADVIVVESTIAAQAAKRATATIPIVMAIVADPLGTGLVASLSHPGANVTGLSLMTADLMAKRLQLLKEAIPRATRAAVLWNPATPFHTMAVQELKAAAPALSLRLTFVAVRGPEDFDSAFSAVNHAHAQALYIMDGAIFNALQAVLLAHTSKARLPTIYGTSDFVEAGGLVSYGANLGDMFRQSAGYVDKILKGAKPGDLPIEQPTKFELAVNLKTANFLGITIPESILLRADEVIR